MLLRTSGARGSISQLDDGPLEDAFGEIGCPIVGLGAAFLCSAGSDELDVDTLGVSELLAESGAVEVV